MVGGLCETAHGLLRRARSWRWHLRTCTLTAASGPASRRRAKEKPRARPDLLVSPAGKGVPHGPRQPAAAANTLWANLADHRGQTKSTARRGDLRRRGSVSAAERTVVFSYAAPSDVHGSVDRPLKAIEDATTARRRRQDRAWSIGRPAAAASSKFPFVAPLLSAGHVAGESDGAPSAGRGRGRRHRGGPVEGSRQRTDGEAISPGWQVWRAPAGRWGGAVTG